MQAVRGHRDDESSGPFRAGQSATVRSASSATNHGDSGATVPRDRGIFPESLHTRVTGLDVGTVVHLPPEPVYDFLVDFPQYGDYSEYLESVERRGDGSTGTAYDITVAWWRLRHTVRSEVTAVHPPERIEWRVTDPVDAHGAWVLDPVPDRAPASAEMATAVTLEIRYEPASVGTGALDLPPFVSADLVLDRVRPTLQREAEAVVERVVEDLEGAPRPVDLEVGRAAAGEAD